MDAGNSLARCWGGALVLSINSAQIPPALVQDARVILGYRAERLGQPYASLIAEGVWSMDRVAGTHGEVIVGRQAGRAREDQTVVADMLGMSVWDVALLRWAYDWAVAHEVGTFFQLSGV